MEAIPVVFFFILVFLVVSAFSGLVQGRTQWTRSFEQIATRYGGWFSAARLTRPPAATFQYRGVDCRIRCKRSRSRAGPETEMRIRWPSRSFRMEIVQAGMNAALRTLRGRPPVLVNDDAFDSQFQLYLPSHEKHLAEQMVSNGVRWHIYRLKSFLEGIPVRIAVDKGWLTIRKEVYIKSPQELDDFVRFCLELHDQFALTMTEGIEFREDLLMTAVEDLHCPICSSDIDGKMVICVRCKTPHCLDCWQYNVKCGMYACDETRYILVGSENTPDNTVY